MVVGGLSFKDIRNWFAQFGATSGFPSPVLSYRPMGARGTTRARPHTTRTTPGSGPGTAVTTKKSGDE